jgi:hypothetical protein
MTEEQLRQLRRSLRTNPDPVTERLLDHIDEQQELIDQLCEAAQVQAHSQRWAA